MCTLFVNNELKKSYKIKGILQFEIKNNLDLNVLIATLRFLRVYEFWILPKLRYLNFNSGISRIKLFF